MGLPNCVRARVLRRAHRLKPVPPFLGRKTKSFGEGEAEDGSRSGYGYVLAAIYGVADGRRCQLASGIVSPQEFAGYRVEGYEGSFCGRDKDYVAGCCYQAWRERGLCQFEFPLHFAGFGIDGHDALRVGRGSRLWRPEAAAIAPALILTAGLEGLGTGGKVAG